ncbi:hypothetical protein P7C73_g5332, partial [Tremellales sp. Uapishka_1]
MSPHADGGPLTSARVAAPPPITTGRADLLTSREAVKQWSNPAVKPALPPPPAIEKSAAYPSAGTSTSTAPATTSRLIVPALASTSKSAPPSSANSPAPTASPLPVLKTGTNASIPVTATSIASPKTFPRVPTIHSRPASPLLPASPRTTDSRSHDRSSERVGFQISNCRQPEYGPMEDPERRSMMDKRPHAASSSSSVGRTADPRETLMAHTSRQAQEILDNMVKAAAAPAKFPPTAPQTPMTTAPRSPTSSPSNPSKAFSPYADSAPNFRGATGETIELGTGAPFPTGKTFGGASAPPSASKTPTTNPSVTFRPPRPRPTDEGDAKAVEKDRKEMKARKADRVSKASSSRPSATPIAHRDPASSSHRSTITPVAPTAKGPSSSRPSSTSVTRPDPAGASSSRSINTTPLARSAQASPPAGTSARWVAHPAPAPSSSRPNTPSNLPASTKTSTLTPSGRPHPPPSDGKERQISKGPPIPPSERSGSTSTAPPPPPATSNPTVPLASPSVPGGARPPPSPIILKKESPTLNRSLYPPGNPLQSSQTPRRKRPNDSAVDGWRKKGGRQNMRVAPANIIDLSVSDDDEVVEKPTLKRHYEIIYISDSDDEEGRRMSKKRKGKHRARDESPDEIVFVDPKKDSGGKIVHREGRQSVTSAPTLTTPIPPPLLELEEPTEPVEIDPQPTLVSAIANSEVWGIWPRPESEELPSLPGYRFFDENAEASIQKHSGNAGQSSVSELKASLDSLEHLEFDKRPLGYLSGALRSRARIARTARRMQTPFLKRNVRGMLRCLAYRTFGTIREEQSTSPTSLNLWNNIRDENGRNTQLDSILGLRESEEERPETARLARFLNYSTHSIVTPYDDDDSRLSRATLDQKLILLTPIQAIFMCKVARGAMFKLSTPIKISKRLSGRETGLLVALHDKENSTGKPWLETDTTVQSIVFSKEGRFVEPIVNQLRFPPSIILGPICRLSYSFGTSLKPVPEILSASKPKNVCLRYVSNDKDTAAGSEASGWNCDWCRLGDLGGEEELSIHFAVCHRDECRVEPISRRQVDGVLHVVLRLHPYKALVPKAPLLPLEPSILQLPTPAETNDVASPPDADDVAFLSGPEQRDWGIPNLLNQQGSLADLLPALDGLWMGNDRPVMRENEENIWRWYHLSEKRRFVMCCWNRFVNEKGPITSTFADDFLKSWVDKYGPIMKKAQAIEQVMDQIHVLFAQKAIKLDSYIHATAYYDREFGPDT